MKIAFIRPNMFARQSKDAMAPLVFAIIKAITPVDVDIRFYDENVEKIPKLIDADVIAMTVDTFSARRAYQLATSHRARGLKVIMGGFHPTMAPDECLGYADSVVIGEAEDTWPTMIEDLKNHALESKYYSKNNTDLSSVVYDQSAYAGKKYKDIGMIQFSRGCKFKCDFCSIHAFYRDNIRCRDLHNVVEEIRGRKEKFFFFIDDNLFTDEDKAKELFKALIPLKKKWFCQISIDAARDIELLKLMKQSGCLGALIGFESLNIENLKVMKKAANLQNIDYDKILANLYDCNLMVYGTFVIGYDFDTENSLNELVIFALKNQFMIANFNPLMPMPGTTLYERLMQENKLVHQRWWLDETFKYGDAMLVPNKMTPEDLMQGCREARFTFYSWRNIIARFFHRKANAHSLTNQWLFLVMNWISRKEIYSKQGRRLGEFIENHPY